MIPLFWGSFALIASTYLGYPLVMVARSALATRRSRASSSSGPRSEPPRVSVVLAVRNGARWLDRRVENLLAQEYPSGKLEVLIVCNGCTDGSDGLAERWARREGRVRALVSPAPEGKAGALNAGVAAAESPVVVFADVRQRFDPSAVARLAARFADPEVGAVTGRLVVEASDRPGVEGFGRYWALETRLRMAESDTGSVIGATGAIYAVRRALYPPIPAETLLDDVYVPLRIAHGGARVVMEPEAVAYDTPAETERDEYRRRVRTLAGNLQLLRLVPGILSPFRGLGWRFVFHKLLRVLSPILFAALLVAGLTLPGLVYRGTGLALIALYLLGALGLAVRHPALAIPSAFVLIQSAGVEALVRRNRTAARLWTR